MQEKARFHIIYLVVAVACVLLVQQFLHEARTVALVPYSEFQQLLKDRKISEVEIVADTLQGTLKEPKEGKQRFVTTRVEPELAKELDDAGVRYARREENTLLPQLLSWIVPALGRKPDAGSSAYTRHSSAWPRALSSSCRSHNGSPAAVRICACTKSTPQTASVTACSTCNRVFISRK